MRQPRLDMRHLQMMSALASTQRVTDAAEQLGITSSALSHRIMEAERRLDTPLFTRFNKRLKMTPAAEHLAQIGARLLDELLCAEDDIRRLNRGVNYVVRLSIQAYGCFHWLPDFVRYLRQKEDNIGLQIVKGTANDPVEDLANGFVDVAVVFGEKDRSNVDVIHLFDDDLVMIMSPDHRLAGREFITGQDVVGEDFIIYDRIPAADREYAKLFRPNGTFPNWKETMELPEAIIEMVAAGLGTSVLTSWAVDRAIKSKRILGARVGPEGISVPWYAATLPGTTDALRCSRRVAGYLAEWSNLSGGLSGSSASGGNP